MKRTLEQRGTAPKRHKTNPSPKHFECPEGNAFLHINKARDKIRVLLDSGSNLFLLNKETPLKLNIPYEIRKEQLEITNLQGRNFLLRRKIPYTLNHARNRSQWTDKPDIMQNSNSGRIRFDHNIRIVAPRTSDQQ